jgi:hypothetical protein
MRTVASVVKEDASEKEREWAAALDAVISEGIAGADFEIQVAARWMKLLHPRLRENTIKSLVAASDIHSVEFWRLEADRSLNGAVLSNGSVRQTAVMRIQTIWPKLDANQIAERMEQLATKGLPEWLQDDFWSKDVPPEKGVRGSLQQILTAGIKNGKRGERCAIDAVLKLDPTLRVEVIRARIRYLRGLRGKHGQKGVPFGWTPQLEKEMQEIFERSGLDAAVSALEDGLGWPRDAILRKARKLGLSKRKTERTPWSDTDLAFLTHYIQHSSVRFIASELGRTEKAVWRKLEYLGLGGKCGEGYTVRALRTALRIRHSKLKQWIAQGLIKKGEDGRIPERSLVSFFSKHRDKIAWDTLAESSQAWILELATNSDVSVEEHSGRARKRRDTTPQKSEKRPVAQPASNHRTRATTHGSDPS